MNEIEKYYVLIKINNNTDLAIVNNMVQVIGIFSSKKDAEEKINSLSLSNLNPKYIIQGPFSVDKSTFNTFSYNPRPILIPNPIPNPDIFNPDIFNDISPRGIRSPPYL